MLERACRTVSAAGHAPVRCRVGLALVFRPCRLHRLPHQPTTRWSLCTRRPAVGGRTHVDRRHHCLRGGCNGPQHAVAVQAGREMGAVRVEPRGDVMTGRASCGSVRRWCVRTRTRRLSAGEPSVLHRPRGRYFGPQLPIADGNAFCHQRGRRRSSWRTRRGADPGE